MSKILAVFGATGHQGSSVITYVQNDTELSQQYKIRAITRDANSEKVKHLKGKVEIVQADMTDPVSLEIALTGVHTVFAMTTPSLGPDALEIELNISKTIADVAVKKGVEYFIFSTLPAVSDISGGKYTKVAPFDAKAKAEQYIRTLPIKSAFYCPANFMENFETQPFLAPRPAPDGTWVMYRHVSPKTPFPLIDAVGDTGKFIGAILAEPDKYEGKTFHAATAIYTLEEIAAAWSRSSGKTIVYKQISAAEFEKTIPVFTDVFVEALMYLEEFGYFGPNSKELIDWAVENARGRLTTLEEYLEIHPFRLE